MNAAAFIRVAAVLLLAATVRPSTSAAQGNQFTSANGQFTVELSLSDEKDLLVTVLQSTNSIKSIFWSRATKWAEPEPHWTPMQIHEVKALVTNDGNTVVLRDNNTVEEKNGIHIIKKSAPNVHATRVFKRRELTGRKPADPPMRSTSYLHVGSILDFILEDKNTYALWFGQTDQWLLISLENFQETVVSDPTALATLNEFAYARAREIVLEHQPPQLRRIVGSIKERIAKLIPSLAAPTYPRSMYGETTPAYLFLTARREPSDASLIKGLIDFEQRGTHHGHGPMRERIELDFSVSHSERLIGDFLWSRWNGDTNREILAREMYQLLPQDTYRYLGCVEFKLLFPVDIPSTNTGTLWAYLIPADVPPEEWHRSRDLITFQSSLSYRPFRPGVSATLGREGKVDIRALTPGEYRAKFIWERNTPAAGMWGRTNVYLGTTNDYQSILTQPITIRAGETIKNISVSITNLIGTTSTQAP